VYPHYYLKILFFLQVAMPELSTSSVGCTCFALRKLTRTVTRLYDQHLAAVALKTTQYSLLKSVAHEALPVAELAARLSTERTTLTRNLKPLIAAGWIELKPGPDARQRIVTITPDGRDTIKAARQAWRRAQAELERALGMDMVRSLHLHVDTALEQLTPLLGEHAKIHPD
jgi:DNA-binding MarR family transcriptional regulator